MADKILRRVSYHGFTILKMEKPTGEVYYRTSGSGISSTKYKTVRAVKKAIDAYRKKYNVGR